MEKDAIHDLVERYVAVWNEPDAQARRAQIASLWADDGEHCTPSLHVRGHAALEQRVIGAWQKWVRDANHCFRSCRNADSHHGGVKFHWEMITPEGEVSSLGFEFLVLGADGRIAADYLFIEPASIRVARAA